MKRIIVLFLLPALMSVTSQAQDLTTLAARVTKLENTVNSNSVNPDTLAKIIWDSAYRNSMAYQYRYVNPRLDSTKKISDRTSNLVQFHWDDTLLIYALMKRYEKDSVAKKTTSDGIWTAVNGLQTIIEQFNTASVDYEALKQRLDAIIVRLRPLADLK